LTDILRLVIFPTYYILSDPLLAFAFLIFIYFLLSIDPPKAPRTLACDMVESIALDPAVKIDAYHSLQVSFVPV
jgi:hypothetical protein